MGVMDLFLRTPVTYEVDPDAEVMVCVSDNPDDPVYRCPHCGLDYHNINLFCRGKKAHTFKCDKCENNITVNPISTS